MITYHKSLSILSMLILIVLTSCAGGQAPVIPTSTVTVPPTVTFTPSPTLTPTPTFTPTATPTPRIPVLPGTQIPASEKVISADNLDQVVELARWGKGVITDVAYSPDGKSVAVGTTLGVSLYQADTMKETLYFETDASVNSLAFSPGGEIIATGLNDNMVKLWNLSDGTLIMSIDGHVDENAKKGAEKSEVTSIAFSPDGSQLAGGSSDGTVSLWQALDGSLVNAFKNHTDKVTGVLFSPDGGIVYSASVDGKVRMINVSDGKIIRSFGRGMIVDLALSADGKVLIADERYGLNHNLQIWNNEDGKTLQTIKLSDYYDITSIAISPDGQYLGAAWEDHTAKVWSVQSGVLQNSFEDLVPKDGWYYLADFAISFSPDSKSLIIAGTDILGMWDLSKAKLVMSTTMKSKEINDIELSPNEQILASVDGPDVVFWQLSDGSLQSSQDLMQSNGNVVFSPDGSTLLVSMFDKTVQLWPLSEQGVRKSFESDAKEYIGAVALSADGQSFALVERYTGKVEIRQVSDGALIKSMQIGTKYGMGSLLFTPDGKYLVAALNDQARLFTVEDGKTVKSIKGCLGIALSPDGSLLAGGGENKTLSVWKIPEGNVLLTLKERPDVIQAVKFSPDGRYLVSGTADGTIEVFLVSDGTLMRSWKGHSELVSDLLFTSDGKYLISASYDGTIRMWGIKP